MGGSAGIMTVRHPGSLTSHPERSEGSAARGIGDIPVADTTAIRKAFPSMQRKHQGHPVAYLDGPGGTQVPQVVVDAMSDYLVHHNANTHWKYPTSEETDALILNARESLATFVNGSADEIAFGANMTTLTFHVARALGRAWGPNDEIVITELDHHGNVAPWRALERERGVRIRTARLRVEDGTLDFDDLKSKITSKTRLVAIGAASNALGTIVDVAAVARVARAVGAIVFVDAVHYAPHTLVDVKQLDADFLAMSAYKFYGPHIGVLWGRKQLVEKLDVPKLQPAPEESPERLETGTQNHEGIVGAGAAVDFLASLAQDPDLDKRGSLERVFARLHERGADLFRRLHEGLGAIRGVRRFGLPAGARRTPTLSFTVDGTTPDDVAVALAKQGLFVSHGDFYAATVIDRLRELGVGEDGVVRIGCSCYTTADEIDRVLRAVAEL
jgi:cysteine desulfurase family protein (TIGR01976 family)